MKIPWLNREKLNDTSIEVKVFYIPANCFNNESKQGQKDILSELIESRDLIPTEIICESSLLDDTGHTSNMNGHFEPKYILNMSDSPVIVINQSEIIDENFDDNTFDSPKGENQVYEKEKLKSLIDFINIRVPVVVGEYKISICLDEPIIIKDKVLRIKDISNSVTLTKCRFIPTEISSMSENRMLIVLNGNLLLEGLLYQDIEYTISWDEVLLRDQQQQKVMNPTHTLSLPQNVRQPEILNKNKKFPNADADFDSEYNHQKDYSGKSCSMSREAPFSKIIEINDFLRPLIIGDKHKNTFAFRDQTNHSDSQIQTKLLNEKTTFTEEPYCCLIGSEINEDITLINPVHDSKVHKSASLLEQKIALEVYFHLLQVQTIRVNY